MPERELSARHATIIGMTDQGDTMRPALGLPLRDVIALPFTELHDRIQHILQPFDPGGRSIPCPLEGCWWSLYIPAVALEWDDTGTAVTVDGVPTATVEQRLADHYQLHAWTTETGIDRTALEDDAPDGWAGP